MIYKTLYNIIDKKVIIPVNTEKKNITLIETDPGAKLERIIISGFTDAERCIAFKLDYKNLRHSQYLSKSQKQINKGCDAVIITEINNGKYIFFCELKSDSPKGYTSQFLSSYAFIDYIDSLVDKFFHLPINEFKKICVLFKLKRISKKGVYRLPQEKTLNPFTRVPLFIEDNCQRTDNFVDLKKYIR